MKLKFSLLFCLLYFSINTFATTYYISRAGNDNNNGTSAATPWKNIGKINLEMDRFEPGDKILFRRGDNFGGSIAWNRSGTAGQPITIGAYENGAKPVITGAIAISGWQHLGGNIWRSGCRVCPDEVTSFYLDSQVQPIGRTPNLDDTNGGYLFYESFSGRNQITDNEFNTSESWVGAELILRTNRSILDRRTIQAVNNKTITLDSDVTTDIRAGYGYFLQHHLSTLDQNGEWFWDADASTFYLYMAGNDPNNMLAATTWYDLLLQFYNDDNIIVENLVFYGAKREALRIGDGENVTVQNCEFLNTGETGVYIYRTDVRFENNKIDWSNNTGLALSDVDNAIIKNNTISNSGIIAGMGRSSYGNYEGMNVSGNNALIELNTIINSGYTGLYFSKNNITIRKNFIKNSCLVKSGSAGIYSYDGNNDKVGRKVHNNIVMNVPGAPLGTDDPTRIYADGIKLSAKSSSVEIIGNTVAYAATNGIFIQGSKNSKVENNKVYGNGRQIWVYDSYSDDASRIQNLSIKNNVFFSTDKDARVAEYQTVRPNINNLGTFNNNKYARPLKPETLIRRMQKPSGSWVTNDYNVDFWNDNTNHDANSGQSPLQIPAFTVNSYRSNNMFTNPNFNNNLDDWHKYGQSNSNIYNQNWVTGQLDGGCIEYSFTSSSGDYMVGYVDDFGTSTAGKKYLLEFSVKGTNKGDFRIDFIQDYSPYQQLMSNQQSVYHTTGRRNVQYVFDCVQTETNPRIQIRIYKPTNKIWFDNFKLREVEVIDTNPADHFRLLTNPTNAPVTVNLPVGTFKDVYNNTHVGVVTLNAFSSKILISENVVTPLPIDLVSFTADLQKDNSVLLNWKAENAESFDHFEIERSTNSFDFNEIGQVIRAEKAINYQFIDTEKQHRTMLLVYYRLKMVDQDGAFSYSNVVAVQLPMTENEVNIYPNPASHQVQISVAEASNNSFLELINMNGQVVKKQRITEIETVMNIADLPRGIYFIRQINAIGEILMMEKLSVQ